MVHTVLFRGHIGPDRDETVRKDFLDLPVTRCYTYCVAGTSHTKPTIGATMNAALRQFKADRKAAQKALDELLYSLYASRNIPDGADADVDALRATTGLRVIELAPAERIK